MFLADGANWIWDRVLDLARPGSMMILDFFHARERVSDVQAAVWGRQRDVLTTVSPLAFDASGGRSGNISCGFEAAP